MAAEIHVGDTGTAFEATVVDEAGAVINVAAATSIRFWFARPAVGTLAADVLDVAGALSADGTDGKVRYVAQDGDLDRAGSWQVQAYVVVGGEKVHGNITRFKVVGNLK